MSKSLCIDLSLIRCTDVAILNANSGEALLRRNILCSILMELGYQLKGDVGFYYVDDSLMDLRAITEAQVIKSVRGIPTSAHVIVNQINPTLFNIYFFY